MFSNKRQKGGSEWEVRCGGTGRRRSGGNHDQDALYKKKVFSIKGKKKEKMKERKLSCISLLGQQRLLEVI